MAVLVLGPCSDADLMMMYHADDDHGTDATEWYFLAWYSVLALVYSTALSTA